jgi:DNA mismatch repair protein MLH1
MPLFLLRLATNVKWDDESECFDTLAAELARFYSEQAPTPMHIRGDTSSADSSTVSCTVRSSSLPLRTSLSADAHVTKHVLFPAFRSMLQPPCTFAGDKTVMQLACLEELYKIFERC